MRAPLLLVALALAGCEDVITVDLGDGAPPRLVVEGVVVAGSSVQRVVLTTTAPYFEPGPAPPASGAVVTVSDDLGRSWTFPETASGVYESADVVAEPGRTYTLDVALPDGVADGGRYRAVDVLRPVPPIDALRLAFVADAEAGDGYRVRVDFRDPPGRGDGYRWTTLADGEVRRPPELTVLTGLLADDERFDGRRVEGYGPNEDAAFFPGETVTVVQQSLSPRALAFYRVLLEQSSPEAGGAGPFDVPPVNVRGNVANLTTPDRPAFGFFLATNVATAQVVAPPFP